MNLYADDSDGVTHNIVMYDGVIVVTECGTSFAIMTSPRSHIASKRVCGKCFPSLN